MFISSSDILKKPFRGTCMTLGNIVCRFTTQLELVQEGGLKLLFKLLKSEEEDVTCAAARAIRNLATSHFTQVQIIKEGYFKALVRLSKISGNERAARYAKETLSKIDKHLCKDFLDLQLKSYLQ